MKVSVVIPAFNAEAFLADTVESVLRQTHPAHEIIVVDDGSTDRTAQTLPKHPSVRLVQQKNAGESAARNTGMSMAEGDVIAFVDADDLWAPDKLAAQLEFLGRRPEYVAVGSGYRDWDGRAYGADVPTKNLEPAEQSPRVHFLGIPASVRISTLMVRCPCAVRFPVGVPANADVFFMTLLAAQGPIGAVERSLVAYRKHPAQVTGQSGFFEKLLDCRLQFAAEHASLLGLRTATESAHLVYRNAADWLRIYRWTRDVAAYRAYKRVLLARWPADLPRDPELDRTMPPRFLLRVADRAASLFGVT